jgi:hypothetical protein
MDLHGGQDSRFGARPTSKSVFEISSGGANAGSLR